jgi:flavin reductase (DIM6/NTAB) family NADH-FMN oxidoreductase RutF
MLKDENSYINPDVDPDVSQTSTRMSVETSNTSPVHPTEGAPAAADARHVRDCLGMFATGVTIITTRAADGGFIGLTANSFNSLSLDPPLVLWSLGLKAGSLPVFMNASHFAVSVLGVEQRELAMRFSRPGTNRFAGVRVHAGHGGAPLIDGALAWFECETRTHYRHGDHILFIGEVLRCARAQGDALMFQQGHFGVPHPIPREPTG